MSDLPKLFLIRHGETAWSLSGQHTGHTDIPLTPHGEDMARELAPLLAPVRFAHILTSPRIRARRTCALATQDAPARIEPDLAEWDYGDYEGLLTADIRKERPGWQIFRDGCPGGEDLADVVARADRLLARLRMQQGPVALFAHGHFGAVLGARWLGLPGEAARHMALDPASISILGPKPREGDVPMLLHWNIVPPARMAYQNPD